MNADDPVERRYYEAQLTARRDMCAHYARIAAEKEAKRKAERQRAALWNSKYLALKDELDVLRVEYADLSAKFRETDARLRQVLSSRTWRAMEPVRMVGRAIQKLRRLSR